MTRWHFQCISGGDIKIYRKDGSRSFELVGETNDPDPIEVEYVSFGSSQASRAQFHFNCSFSLAATDAVSTATDHPLLAKTDAPPTVDLRNCKMNEIASIAHTKSTCLWFNFSVAN